MPYINIEGKNIYYREFGKGNPIVFLNGLMMNTSSWLHLVKYVSKNYRMILIDLIDQGRSDSYEANYTIDTQADILNAFLEKLKIEKINLLGISYGGRVALTYAIKYKNKVKSLILANTDSYISNIMKDVQKAWAHAASSLDGEIFSSIVFPYIYSFKFYQQNYDKIQENKKMMSKVLDEEWKDRFIRNINSSRNYNVSHLIRDIRVPTLIIGAEYDLITLLDYQKYIHKEIEGSKLVIMKDTGHAALFEKPNEFISIIMEFLKEKASLQ
ncbi:MAG: alpha/beta hydrolase [Tissierellia bacterium]|nr:alpha/beta hydrolase [Tissierellia bacterium]